MVVVWRCMVDSWRFKARVDVIRFMRERCVIRGVRDGRGPLDVIPWYCGIEMMGILGEMECRDDDLKARNAKMRPRRSSRRYSYCWARVFGDHHTC